jgi:single-stranded-DNA-specific exonuclease
MATKTAIRTDTRWLVAETRPVPPALAVFDAVTAQILLQRGITTTAEAEAFLRPDLANLNDGQQLAGLAEAVVRIQQAIAAQESIVVYGDYDVDGVTSATILSSAIRELGGMVSVYLPERMKEGYGLNETAIRQLQQDGAQLIVTVDTGTTSIAAIELINSLGMAAIVVDHHQITGELPNALAVVNPRRPDCQYPFKELAAVGVTYQVARALLGKGANQYLDLVALGTVADVVPLVGDNRTLVVAGLAQLNSAPRPGVAALIEVAGLADKSIDAYHIGFQLGPRLNAAGRIDHARLAFDLLNAPDLATARPLAQQLNDLNTRRQELTERILTESRAAASESQDKIIITGGEAWSVGVVGIVAGRLVEEFSKPAIVFEYQDEVCKGSCRSVDGVNIVELLGQAREWIQQFGGHAKAAGLSVVRANFEKFKRQLIDVANKTIDAAWLVPTVRVDMMLAADQVSPKLLATVETLMPFGFGNPTPVFGVAGLRLVAHELVGGGGAHLRLTLADDNNRTVQVMAFDGWELALKLELNARYDIALSVSAREWNGRSFMQCKLVGIRPTA